MQWLLYSFDRGGMDKNDYTKCANETRTHIVIRLFIAQLKEIKTDMLRKISYLSECAGVRFWDVRKHFAA